MKNTINVHCYSFDIIPCVQIEERQTFSFVQLPLENVGINRDYVRGFREFLSYQNPLLKLLGRFVEQFAQSGCDCFVFQIEKTDSSTVGELIAKIKDSGMKVDIRISHEKHFSILVF